MTAKEERAPRVGCPSCGRTGRPVKPITVQSLVTEEARARAGRTDGLHFCAEPSCDVAYFHPESAARIARSDVRVRIGQKESEPPRTVCYCFGHTIEAIEAEVAATGASRIAGDVAEKCRRGLDRCEETNPQGSCCLGNVQQAVREAQAKRTAVAAAVPAGAGSGEGATCCAPAGAASERARRPRRPGLWAAAGATAAAILSSACCWLPLVLVAAGASAAGVSGLFEACRPYLLAATGLLLAGGFYLTYFRRERCGPGEACAATSPRRRRFQKVMLWIATAVVFAFAFFPDYAGYLLGGGDREALDSPAVSGEVRTLRIEGMTCAGCAAALEAALSVLPGVTSASVSYERGEARITAGPSVSEETLRRAVSEAGYTLKAASR